MEVAIGVVTAAIFLFLQILVSFSSIPPINSMQSPLCHPSQSFALLQFMNHLDTTKSACGDFELPTTNSWREGTDCCLWEGVVCDESTGNIISFRLECLHGQIPTNSSLFQLSHLKILLLSDNDFNRSPVLSELGRLVNLRHLEISSSNFSGMIPSQMSHLSNLISLHIVDYFISFDSLTFEMLSRNLTRLKDLSLRCVNMSVVNLQLFLNLSSSLESLDLYDSHLNGKFPVDVFRFVNLKYFSVWNNPKLTITLPKSNWSGPLESLKLSNSSFSTENFYALVNLKSFNSLYLENCGLRLIPGFISNLTLITELSLQDNNITGEIPTYFSNLKRLSWLSMPGNNFKGQIPSSIFSLPQLSMLYLSHNELVSLPSNVTDFSNLVELDLSSNKLTGSIPSWLFNLRSLADLDLSNNQLSGEIPEFQSQSLWSISLTHNRLCGPIPVSMFQLQHLTSLFLSSNNLFFGIRELEEFQKLKSLRRLSLSHNNISVGNIEEMKWERIPHWRIEGENKCIYVEKCGP